MRYITLPITEDKDYALTTTHVLVQPDGKRHGVGCIARGKEGRQVYQGPLVPGPWAFAFGLATVICSNPNLGTYGDIQRGRANKTEHDVEEGDHVIIDDVEYSVRFTDGFGRNRGKREFIKLDLVKDLKA